MIICIVLLQLFAHLDESTVQRVTQASRDVGVANTSIHGIVCKSHQTPQIDQETDCEPVMMENELTSEEHDESMDENMLGENEDQDENEEEENESESEDWNVSESEDWNESESEDKDFDEEVGSVFVFLL